MAAPKSKKSANAAPKAADTALVKSFLDVMRAQVPAEDLALWGDADQRAVARIMTDWGQSRKNGQHKVRVFTPAAKSEGWETPHTIIAIVNDDMPFIVDSVSAEITHAGYHVESLFHPIVAVGRDGQALKKLAAARVNDEHGAAESFIFVRLEQVLTPEAATALEKSLSATLDDVRAATTDWRHMLRKIDEIAAHLKEGETQKWEDVKEAREFLNYVRANNFTFLGYREYSFTGKGGRSVSKSVAGSDLGVMRNAGRIYFDHDNGSPEAEALSQSRWPVMISKLIDAHATVHRRVPMDVISIKITDAQGNMTGMHVFTGLFTSSTYSCRTSDVPIVRQKVRETIERAGFKKGSHDAKALEHILEKMPRDELFQASTDEVYKLALGILRLQSKQRVALFTHLDPMGQYMSCLVYVPRDRYNTRFRVNAQKILEQAINGTVINFYTMLDDSHLARVLFTVRLNSPDPKCDVAQIEQQLVDLGREWEERLRHVLTGAFGKVKGAELAATYGRAFKGSYHESIALENSVHDIRHLEHIVQGHEKIRIDFYSLNDAPAEDYRLKVFNAGKPVPLFEILPVLENMGLKAVSEMPYEVHPLNYNGAIWIHDFELKGTPKIDIPAVKNNFEQTFLEIWKGSAENDGLNALVLLANLDWRQIMILRTYSNYMRQARFPFSRRYVEQVLALYPHIARSLVALFEAMHNPANVKTKSAAIGEDILASLQNVDKLDHDRIIRGMKTLIENTLRTNYYQKGADGNLQSVLAVKLDSKNIADLPLPRPHVEIFVYSPRVEAIHLRMGEIARGGIRWSDRADDYRTEVLGLMKSQQVKNTVIVPVGAKGGFIVKQPPKDGGRAAYQAEGIECYKIFIQALLDITDNNVKGKVVHPRDVVCRDGEDPYLVVAADKGTATFSDIANSLSLKAGFWLGDAFASGGSAGYDHKVMGITAKGGWESVKRHFRELGKDIQKEDFIVTGVGDMGGDVFGNAMLLSKHIRLIAAFNHVHIFCDPNPDAASSLVERQRLFDARGGWDAYDKTKISAGGAVFERSAKTVKITPQIKKSLGLTQDSMTPDELIRAILKAETELLWFGGIGTYVKSSRQSQADADDKTNDNLRVDARDIPALVIGEGANLGVTQLARVEFAHKGGKINTDFIDNSAGVDCSDHEVNIKILLTDVMARSSMTTAQRDKLLASMTDNVGQLVLRDNYDQTQSLSLQSLMARELLGVHAEYIRTLEKQGLLKRNLEGLPDDEGFARMVRDGQGLSRPELAILTSYAKIALYNEILKTNIPDDPSLEHLLFAYFPKALQKYEKEIRAHRLKREIITTQVVNAVINRMGAVFVPSRMAKTGASAPDVVRAFLIVQSSFRLHDVWSSIEALDNKVPSAVQTRALHDIYLTGKRAVTWFLRFGAKNQPMAIEIDAFTKGVDYLHAHINDVLSQSLSEKVDGIASRLTEQGMPEKLSRSIAVLQSLASAADIISIAQKAKADLAVIGKIYFSVGERLGLIWLRQKTAEIVPENSWQARVRSAVLDDLYHQQAVLSAMLAKDAVRLAKKAAGANKAAADEADVWFHGREGVILQADGIVNELRHQDPVKLEMLVLVTQRMGQAISQVTG